MKKIFVFILCLIIVFGFLISSFARGKNDDISISDPYAGVNWESVDQFKIALHSHTNASDGDMTLRESIERHLQTGFDIVAVTDHGIVDRGWENAPKHNLIKTALDLFGRSEGALDYLGSSGIFAGGESYVYETGEDGDNFLKTESGRTILRLPYGIEQNAVSVNAHATSWFAPFSFNGVSGYEEGLCGVERNGGLCVINHPGEYTKARYELSSDKAYNESNFSYAYHINKFARYIDKYESCIGIDINSKGDNRTRFDRILWDRLLDRFSAKGENVFAIASSDAHQLSVIDSGFTILLLPELSSSCAKDALKDGAFFPASHCIGNPDELSEIAASLNEFYGEGNETYLKVKASLDEIEEKLNKIKSGDAEKDGGIGVEYSVLDDNGFSTVDSFPKINEIEVNDDENTIKISSADALIVRFISGGKTFKTVKANEATIDLDDYASELSDYVRAEVFGEGGILYTQAFLLNAEENSASGAKVTKGVFVDLGKLDFIIAEIHKWLSILFG